MRSRRGIGILAVCGLVLGLMAIAASAAQAEAGSAWMVNNKNITAKLAVEAELKQELAAGATLLTTSGANAVAISCTTTKITEAVLEAEGHATGKVSISGCSTKINGTSEPECKPKNEPIAAGGTLLIVLHNGVGYILAKGTTEGVFATLKFECAALPESVKITGSGWLEDCEGKLTTELVTHLVQEAMVPALALGGLLFGKNAATIDGSGNLTLIGAHKGLTFSALPK